MTTKRIIFGILAIIGLIMAISVTDNSNYEIVIRIIGVAMFMCGSILGDWLNINED